MHADLMHVDLLLRPGLPLMPVTRMGISEQLNPAGRHQPESFARH